MISILSKPGPFFLSLIFFFIKSCGFYGWLWLSACVCRAYLLAKQQEGVNQHLAGAHQGGNMIGL